MTSGVAGNRDGAEEQGSRCMMRVLIFEHLRHHRLLRRGLSVMALVCAGGAIAWLTGLPQSLYRHIYVALAWPIQIIGESAEALRGDLHWTSWSVWTHDWDARYGWLQGPAGRGMGGPIALEAGLLGLIVGLILWRACWFALTRVGHLAPGTGHGSARWMSARERRHLPYHARPFLLGEVERTSVALDQAWQVRNVLVVGPPGSGKSAGLIIPNLLREDGSRSLIVTDLKNELLQTCYRALARHHEVWVVNFLSPATSLGYNPLAACVDPLSAMLFADAWITNTGRSEKEPFWDNATRELLLAGIAHLRASLDEPTLAHLEDLLCAHAPEAVIAALEHSPSPSARKRACGFMASLARNERLLGSVFSEIAPRFAVMADPRVQATTSRHEVDFRRLVDPALPPVALMLALDRTMQDELKPLAAAFFLDLFRTLAQVADETPGGALGRPVVVLADEFGNLGSIPKMPVWISSLRSANVSMTLAVQTTAQLTAAYGKDGAGTIRASCATRVGLSGMVDEDAKWFSGLSGQATVVQRQASAQRGRFHLTSDSGGQTQSETRRPLLTPDEVQRLAPTELLAMVGAHPALRLRQRRYFEDAEVRHLAPTRGDTWIPPLGPARPEPLTPPECDMPLEVRDVPAGLDGEDERIPAGVRDAGDREISEPQTAAPGAAESSDKVDWSNWSLEP